MICNNVWYINAVSWNVTSSLLSILGLPQDKKLEFNSEGAKAQCRLCRREDKGEERQTRRGSHSMYSQQQVKTELDLQDRMNVLAALNMFSFHCTPNVLSANISMLQTNRMKKYQNPLWLANKSDAHCFHIPLFCTARRAFSVLSACSLKSWISQLVLWICFYTRVIMQGNSCVGCVRSEKQLNEKSRTFSWITEHLCRMAIRFKYRL